MGTATSQFHEIFPFVSHVLSDDHMPTLLSSEINNLTYEEFTSIIKELNQLSKQSFSSDGNRMIFALKTGTFSTDFWRATVQIACIKMRKGSDKIESFRLLNLSQFLKVFKTLKCQLTAAQQSKSCSSDEPDLTISTIFHNVDQQAEMNSLEKQTECCICFERKQEVILPCAHSYCLPCLEKWNKRHDTCPICREKFESSDDTWVLSEVPNSEEISQEIRDNLMDLTEKRDDSSSSSD